MRYYCTQCGAANVRAKVKTNYGCVMSAIDLIFFAGAFFTAGLSLIGCLIVHCCVKKTRICPKCKNENCLIPMKSPQAQKALGKIPA